MARIPTANDIPTTIMRPATGIVRDDQTAIPNAMQGMGNALQNIGKNMMAKADDLEVGDAQSQFLQGKIKTESDFQHDQDYQTMGDRYQTQMSGLVQSSANNIESPTARAKFNEWANNQVTQGQAQINNIVWGKKRDHSIATTQQLANDNMNAALSASDEATKAQLIDATNNSINGLQQSGYISETDAQNMRKSWGSQYATGSLQMMTPEQRIKAIQSNAPMTQFIPENQRFSIMRDAANEALQTKVSNWQLATYTGATTLNNANMSTENLLEAQRQIESGGQHTNPDGSLVTSSAGAQGIAQIMPETAKNPGMGVTPLRDDSPQEAIRFQHDYMNALMNKYGGNTVLALAAYNAGTGNVDKWIQQYGDPSKGQISNDQFAASIPLSETKNYVYRVSSLANRSNNMGEIINSPEFKLLDGKQKDAISSRALQVQDQQSSVLRLNIQNQMNDDMTKANQGIEVANPITESEYMMAIPAMATPAEREQYYQTYNRYHLTMNAQPINNFMIQNSATQGAAMLATMKPDPNDSDFTYKNELYVKQQQNYSRIIQQRESDPGDWIAKYSDVGKQAYQAFQNNQSPETGTALAQVITSERQRLGIKNNDILPKVIINQELANIEGSGESAVVSLQNMASQFGSYGPQVLAQMQKSGGSALRVVSAINNPDASTAIWQVRNQKTGDLRDAGAPTAAARTQLDQDWNSEFSDFSGTLALQTGGMAARTAFNEQGLRLTYLYASQGKSNPAKLAASQMLDQYEIHDTYRINKTIPENQGLNWRNIEDGGAYLVQQLKEGDINPNSFYEPDPRLSKEDNTKIALERIKNADYQWITSPDEKGLALSVNGHYVAGMDGKPIVYPLSVMDATGKQHSGLWNQFVNYLGSDNQFTAPSPTKSSAVGYGLPYEGKFPSYGDLK